MKILVFFLLLFLTSIKAYSVTRPDIDTISILGLTPGLDGKMVTSRVQMKLDTLIWNDNDKTGLVKFGGNYMGNKGDFRIAYDKGFIAQVSFVVPTHNQEENLKTYDRISEELSSAYGPADIETTNTIHEKRWEGIKQSISVKAIDGTQYVTVALSKFEKN